MIRIDPAAAPAAAPFFPDPPGPARPVPAEEAAKAPTKPAIHVHTPPFPAPAGPPPGGDPAPVAPGRPFLPGGKMPPWTDMYRMLLRMEMNDALRRLLYPDIEPPETGDPPVRGNEDVTAHSEARRAERIAERGAPSIGRGEVVFD